VGLSRRKPATRLFGEVFLSMRRLVVAVLLTTLLMLCAAGALYVTSGPRWVSLLVEPVSLILLPGLVIALATSGSHDFPPEVVLAVSAAFYVGLLYAAQIWFAMRRRSSR
jgi:uncharacterized membrane protein YoaK (UPF0700 family)